MQSTELDPGQTKMGGGGVHIFGNRVLGFSVLCNYVNDIYTIKIINLYISSIRIVTKNCKSMEDSL